MAPLAFLAVACMAQSAGKKERSEVTLRRVSDVVLEVSGAGSSKANGVYTLDKTVWENKDTGWLIYRTSMPEAVSEWAIGDEGADPDYIALYPYLEAPAHPADVAEWMVAKGQLPTPSVDRVVLAETTYTAEGIAYEYILNMPDLFQPSSIKEDYAKDWENLKIFVSAKDVGLVAGDDSPEVVTANTVALNNFMSLEWTNRYPLVVEGDYYFSGPLVVGRQYVRIFGYGARFIQLNTSAHGFELTRNSYGFNLRGLFIEGQGPATHDAAGIYGRLYEDGVAVYITSDVILQDVDIRQFRTGISLAQTANFLSINTTIRNVRWGFDFDTLQTGTMLNNRVTTGDNHAESAVFVSTGIGFANRVIGGEFGWGFERFFRATDGRWHFDSMNIEGFAGKPAVFEFTDPTAPIKRLSITNSRMGFARTSDQAIVASVHTNNLGVIALNWSGNHFSGGRILELVGPRGGFNRVVANGVRVYWTDTLGGPPVHDVYVEGAVNQVFAPSALPDPNGFPGMRALLSGSTITPDLWASNPLIRYRSNKEGTNKWGSLSNDMLHQVLFYSDRVTSGASETAFVDDTIPRNFLRLDGESVEIQAFGTTAANNNNKRIRFKWAGSTLFDFGQIPMNNESWSLRIYVQRGPGTDGAANMRILGELKYGTNTVVRVAEGSGDSDAISVAITGEGVTANDIVCLATKATWTRAPQGF